MQRRLMAACAAIGFVFSTAAGAQYGGATAPAPMMAPHMAHLETVLCPTDVKVMITPSPAASDWSYSNATAPMHLDPTNPPHVDPGLLVCYYVFASSNNAFDYSQPLSGRTCKVNADNTGFECRH
jgi:hypothetical protein